MTTAWYGIFGILAVALLYVLLPPMISAYTKYRGKRVIICPETKEPAAVDVDATHAALTSALREPDLRLRDCSRWPEREDCGQECLAEIEASPDGCLVRTRLEHWYADKKCAFCGKPFGTIGWADHKPALMDPGGAILEWRQVRAEKLPEVLASDKPVCWNCRIAETFRREHPDQVVDRTRPPAGS